VTGEKEEDVAAFIEEREVKYPMATSYYSDGYDHRGIPHCYLVDIEGKIAWRGHPAELKESKLHELLAKAKPAYVLAGLEEVHRMRIGEQHGDAYQLGKKLLEQNALSEGAQTQLKGWMSKAEWFVETSVTEADAAEKEGDIYLVWAKLEPVARLYAGVPGSDDAKKRLETLNESKKNRLEIEAGQQFAEAKRLEGEQDFTAAMEIYKELSKRKGRTRAGKTAKVRYREMLEAGMLGFDPRCTYCKAGGSACASHARKR